MHDTAVDGVTDDTIGGDSDAIDDLHNLYSRNVQFQQKDSDLASESHHWMAASAEWPAPKPDNAWISEMKIAHGDNIDRSRTDNFDFSALNVQQHLMPAIVKEHLTTPGSPQLLGLVRGTAGVGKSFVIDALVKLCSTLLKPEEFELCAPTGCAACNVGGCTLHSAFLLPIRGGSCRF